MARDGNLVSRHKDFFREREREEKKQKRGSCFETPSDCGCARVCVCAVRVPPLLTRVDCARSISQLLALIDAAVLFEFNSRHLPGPAHL